MRIFVKIRFSIPATPKTATLQEALRKNGFLVERIKPVPPCSGEHKAYVMTGTFRGQWCDLLSAWHQAASRSVVQEVALKKQK